MVHEYPGQVGAPTPTPVRAAKWWHSHTSRGLWAWCTITVAIRRPFRRAEIDQQLFQEAAILTGIGMGTAFVLLVVLVVVIVFVGRISATLERRFRKVTESGSAVSSDDEALARDKALAAVVAVTALTSGSAPTAERG